MEKKAWLLALCAGVSVGAVTACGSGGSGNSASSHSSGSTATAAASTNTTAGGTIEVGLDAAPPTMDPMKSSALVDRQVMFNIYDILFELTPDGKIKPDLVKSYTVSSDGKTYTLHLRQGIQFQDGTSFNAAAVKFNLERDMQSGSIRKSELTEISGVYAPNSSTVVIHLKSPFSPLLGVLSDRSGMMVSPTAVRKEGSNYANHPVGTGPFEFKSQVKDDHITLVKNPHYWGTPAKLNEVEFKIFTDTNVEATNLESGAIQLTDTVPAQQVSTVQNNANLSVINKPGLGYQGFYINVAKAPFTNRYLREAVNMAIDRNAIVNVVMNGTGAVGYSPFSQAFAVYNKKEDTPPAANAATIKKLLAKGGKPHGFSFTMQCANDSVTVQMVQMIQSMLKKYGIKMNIQQLEFGTLLSNSEDHDFQASQLGWSGRIDPDQNIYQFLYAGGSENDSNYSNKQVDVLLNQARSESKMSARAKTYAQVMAIEQTDVPYVYLYHQNNVFGVSKQVHGFQAYPDGIIRLDTVSIS